MKEKEIKRLIELVEKSNIGELEVSRWGKRVRISKWPTHTNHTISSVPPTTNIRLPQSEPPVIQEQPPKKAEESPQLSEEILEIRSPMVGTFYRAPAPDAEPYVKVGDLIYPGQVLCIIEAMKLMNEIEAECEGKIIEILAENAQPVEYNQVLFRVAQNHR
ncbi:MAG: acetyl-CoA carboxylase biotin carboxyl carrier protein [candidate division KSB1 bacterium]|nr:acetyl-CoA carboxylase biotin carboxyl carrier protein [candidate division KSB1 bacterium]